MAQIRQWWSDNGRNLIVVLVVAVLAVVGYRSWQNSRDTAHLDAHTLYESFQAAVGGSADADADTARYLADQLVAEHGGTGYAALAWLRLARVAVDAENFEEAAAHLRIALQNAGSPGLRDLARVRLARVLRAVDDFDGALTQLGALELSGFSSDRAELRGDILFDKGDRVGALAAYEEALATFEPTDGQDVEEQRPLLLRKRNAVR